MRAQSKQKIFLVVVIFVNYLVICHENLLFSKDLYNINKEVIESDPATSQNKTSPELKFSEAVTNYDIYILSITWGSNNISYILSI